MIEGILKWGIKARKQPEGMWSFGLALSHWKPETYLYINLFKWSIHIGKFFR